MNMRSKRQPRIFPVLCFVASFLWIAAIATVSGFCDDRPKQEGFGFVGIGKSYDDEGSIGKGLSTGGGWGYRLSNRFGMEAEFNWFRTRREFSSMYPPYEGNGAYLNGSGLWYFTQGRAEGYLIGGAGWLHYQNEADFSGSSVDRSGDGFGIHFGSGIKIHIQERLYVRPELRILIGKAGSEAIESPLSHLRLSMGLGYRW